MAENSKIQWTHHTFNPWRGCTKVSPGCANCYAETMSHRNPSVLGEWGPHGKRVIAAESYWRQPLKWDGEARAAGERRRVFCASLADFAEERTDLIDPRRRLFELIGATPNLDWLLLTKRPRFVMEHADLWAGHVAGGAINAGLDNLEWATTTLIPPNIWYGVSVENQAAADERIPLLLQTPAAVRFLSVEPLLGPVNIEQAMAKCYAGGVQSIMAGYTRMPRIDWIIVGGESGAGARPCRLPWIRSIVEQCRAAEVPVFVKQLGSNFHSDGEVWSDAPRHVLTSHRNGMIQNTTELSRFANGRWKLRDRKGGSMVEWPEDLRVREFPRV